MLVTLLGYALCTSHKKRVNKHLPVSADECLLTGIG